MRLLKENLLVQFSLVSFVAMTLIGVGLGYVLAQSIRADAIDDLKAEAVGTAAGRVLLQLEPTDFLLPMVGERYEAFDAFVQRSLVSERTARIKLWAPDGTVIYMDDPEGVGEVFPENASLLGALSGEELIEIEIPDDAENEFERERGTLMEVYTPLTFPGVDHPSGVLEIYQYFGPTQERIKSLQSGTYRMIGGGLAALYAALIWLVMRGWRTIESQRLALHNSYVELKQTEYERHIILKTEKKNRLIAETLVRVGMALNATLELPQLLNLICSESARLFDVEAAFVWLLEGEQLVGYAGHGPGLEQFIGLRVDLGDPVTVGSKVIRERRPTYVNDAPRSHKVNPALIRRFRVKSIMGIPLVKGERSVGALMILDQSNPRRFGSEDVVLAQALGSQAAVAIENAELFEGLQTSHAEIMEAYDRTLEGWSRALELRDDETDGHTRRVTELALRLAEIMDYPARERIHLWRGALLHDIGKMGIPDAILLKPGTLTDAEWELMRKHPEYAYEMLSPISYLQPSLDIPYAHHEKWDGSGYPRALIGEEIPLAARIFAVVDVYDALTSDRPYRDAWTREKALEHIRSSSGSHFDPEVVAAFLELEEMLMEAGTEILPSLELRALKPANG